MTRPRRRKLAGALRASATALPSHAPFGGEVVVAVAVHYLAIKDAVREYGDRLAGKVVVDSDACSGALPESVSQVIAGRSRPGRAPNVLA